MEAVPTIWLYDGRYVEDSFGERIVKAKSYWPKQVNKVASWIDNMRSPGGPTGIVDSSIWDKGIDATILDFCSTS